MIRITLKFLFTLSLLFMIGGCATALSLSQGSVPCAQNEMQIVDEVKAMGAGNPTSWTAICHEKRYFCAARYGSYSAPVVDCVESDE